MANKITPIRFLKTLAQSVRPDPNKLLQGQPALNLESSDPGLYFRGTDGSLFKVGPANVSETAPNSEETGGNGQNSRGELWLDTLNPDGPLLRVYGDEGWVACFPVAYARALISEETPDPNLFLEGTIWWDNSTGLQYILYNGSWVQMGSLPVK
jgi:hypothetical protein